MAHVFLSYVRENSDVVDRLADALRAFGIEVWLDRDRLRPGSRWSDAIRGAIADGAFFIACFSEEYFQREKTYMNEELTLAVEELRQRPVDRSWFIPVLLDDCALPGRSIGGGETLRSIHAVSLHHDWDEGIQRIVSVISPPAGLIHQLVRQLSADSARARIRAADSLGRMGSAAEHAVPDLRALLSDPNETVRAAAADALGSIGEVGQEVVVRLLSITGDDGHPSYPRAHASRALIKIGAAAVPYVIAALGERTGRNREAAIKTLAEMGEVAVPAVTAALTSDNEAVRVGAAEVLGRAGAPRQDPARSALPGLLHMLASEDAFEAATAANALGTLGDPAAVPALVKALADSNYLCGCAALALGRIAVPAAIEPLVGLLRDPDKFWVPRGAAAVALGDMGTAAREALPALSEAAEYDTESPGETWHVLCQEAVADAINRIRDPSAPSALTGHGYRYEMWGRY
ncbi:HEAT repeat domain-containing protein [Streptomyces sp. NRRL F-5126]|uniref:HEAT repeat domain-containing protein n=1 Tax=Streptomyces sp. NRRL F-5126 TaxID=1463857 RepID=UPI0004CBED30|nr:HEAT repeat domain-containing protein [Streptomyces sp. NRRL F-5126]